MKARYRAYREYLVTSAHREAAVRMDATFRHSFRY
jgi:hypothetical protein